MEHLKRVPPFLTTQMDAQNNTDVEHVCICFQCWWQKPTTSKPTEELAHQVMTKAWLTHKMVEKKQHLTWHGDAPIE